VTGVSPKRQWCWTAECDEDLRFNFLTGMSIRALAHTAAFCRSRIRLRSWSFSHVRALPLPAVGFIQTEVFKTVVWHRQIQIRVQVARQYIETDKPHKEDVCAAFDLSSSSPARKFSGPATRPDRLRMKAPIYLHCIRRWSRTRLRFCRCVCKRP